MKEELRLANIMKAQVAKVSEEKFFTLTEVRNELENLHKMDNKVVVSQLVKKGYDEGKARELANYKPLSLNNTLEKVGKLASDIKNVVEYLEELGLILNIKEHIYKSGGDLFISSSLFTTLVIRETKIGAALGLYLLEKINQRSVKVATFGCIEEKEEYYLGYSKAVKFSLTQLLDDLEFVEDTDIDENVIGNANQADILRKEHTFLMLSLEGLLFDRVLSEEINNLDEENLQDLGFTLESEEIVSFYSLNLIPNYLMREYVTKGLATVTTEVIRYRGKRLLKVENIWFEGKLWSEIYRVCFEKSVRVKKEGQV